MRVSLRDDGVAVFAKPDGAGLLVARLKAGDEMELGKSVKSAGSDWVEAPLADGRRGSVPGDTRIKQDEADMFERPSFDAARKARLTKGQSIILLDVVQAGGASWVHIRDLKGHEGFIHGDTAVHTEESGSGSAGKPPAAEPRKPAGNDKAPGPRRGGGPRKAGATDIRNGLVAILLGAVLTGGSYLLAPTLGGKYYVTWGIVVLGALWLLRGIFRTLAGK
jgi:hypothetical protein